MAIINAQVGSAGYSGSRFLVQVRPSITQIPVSGKS